MDEGPSNNGDFALGQPTYKTRQTVLGHHFLQA
jgi:hypothetical protein